MDQIKDAFHKVKRDIESLHFEINSLKNTLNEINWRLGLVSSDLQDLKRTRRKNLFEYENSTKSYKKEIPTQQSKNQTHVAYNTTNRHIFKPLNAQNLGISTGNEGVPTDRQTYRQTDQQTQNKEYDPFLTIKTTPKNNNPIQTAADILDSLSSLKKEIRLKFKRLTQKEILVFSTLYQLDEEKGFADYKTIADKLNLTQSSIRDYIGRLISKGIPVEKNKINNKSIHLNVSDGLKKVANLSTIMQLIKL